MLNCYKEKKDNHQESSRRPSKAIRSRKCMYVEKNSRSMLRVEFSDKNGKKAIMGILQIVCIKSSGLLDVNNCGDILQCQKS